MRVISTNPHNDPDNLERPLGTLPKDFVASVRNAEALKAKETLVASFLDSEYAKEKDFIEERIKLFKKQWEPVNDEYFRRLERILQITLPDSATYVGFLTSAGSCPFNVNPAWFMVRIADNIGDAIAAHEILHIEFRKKYSLYCRDVLKLSPDEFMTIQEATTLLLNEEMGDLLSRPDYGYKEHQQLRKILAKEWNTHKDFKKLLDYYVAIKDTK